jgi:uncharacterized membrane protein (UPF0136 family)
MDPLLVRMRGRFDRLGVVLSCLCAVHCVAGIVLVAGLGIGGTLLLHPAIHKVGLVIATLVAAIAIGMGALRHRRRMPIVVAMTGLCFMAAGLAVGHGTDEMVLTVIGVALVAAGHFLNLRKI